MLLKKAQIFWDVTLCFGASSSSDYEGHSCLMFSVKQSKKMEDSTVL